MSASSAVPVDAPASVLETPVPSAERAHDAHDALPPGAVCASCGTTLSGPYCHACGEKVLDRHDYALAHVVEHGIDAFTHVDLKVLNSLWSLFRRPGVMAADLLAGRRVRWAKPFQLFVVANILYYLIASALHINTFQTPLRYHVGTWYGELVQNVAAGKAAYLGLSAEAYAERFDRQAHTLSKSLLITLVPFVALALHALFAGRRRYYLEHLTVALLVVPALLLLTPLLYPLVIVLLEIAGHVDGSGDTWWTLTSIVVFTAYLFVFLRRTYGGRTLPTLVRAAGLVVAWYAILIYVYRPILFLAAQVLTQR